MARTEDVAAPTNRYDEALTQVIANAQANYVVPGFVTGMNSRYKIGWVYNNETITFFQQVSEGYGFVFEKNQIAALEQTRFLPIDPVITKLEGRIYAFTTDRYNVYVDCLFNINLFSAKIPLSNDQADVIDMVLLEEGPSRVVLRLLSSNGNVSQMAFKRDHTSSFKHVFKAESERGIMSLFPFGNSRKSKSSGPNLIAADYSNQIATTVRLFENHISAIIERTDIRSSTIIKSRNLAATLKSWEISFIDVNKFNLVELRIIDVKLHQNGLNPKVICVYVLYVVTKGMLNLAIPKARLIRLGNQKMESEACVEFPVYFAFPSDTLDMKLLVRNRQSYVAVHIFTHKDKKIINDVVKIDEEVTACDRKHFQEVVNGMFLVANPGEQSLVTCIVMLNDRFDSYESGRVPNLSATKDKSISLSKSAFAVDRSFHLGKRINEEHPESRQRESKEREVAFKVQLEQLFNLFLAKKLSEDEIREELKYLEETFGNEEVAYEIRGMFLQIVDEKNRNWSVATSSEKEDLSKVELLRQNVNIFNDLITIELKRKEKKLQKFIEFLSFNQRFINEGFIEDEYIVIREALLVMLAIRRFEQAHIKFPAIRDFIKLAITETLKKWQTDSSHLHNFDFFYSNLISVQDFFKTSNELLAKQAAQSSFQELLEAYRLLWQEVLTELNLSRQENTRKNTALTSLFKSNRSLFSFLVNFYILYESSGGFDQNNESEKHSKLIELTKHVILESFFQKSQPHSSDINFEELAHSLFAVITKCGKPKEAFLLANA